MRPQLFDLDSDPEEMSDLGGKHEFADVNHKLEAELRLICNPETVDKNAKLDQMEIIELNGGAEAVVKKGGFGQLPHRASTLNMPQQRVKNIKVSIYVSKNATEAHSENYSKQMMQCYDNWIEIQ